MDAAFYRLNQANNVVLSVLALIILTVAAFAWWIALDFGLSLAYELSAQGGLSRPLNWLVLTMFRVLFVLMVITVPDSLQAEYWGRPENYGRRPVTQIQAQREFWGTLTHIVSAYVILCVPIAICAFVDWIWQSGRQSFSR